MRTRAKVDSNQKEVVAVLRKFGASVEHLHTLGKGAPDILVGFRNKNYLFEIKDGSKPPSAQQLTEDEKLWHMVWAGQVAVVRSPDEALSAIGVK